MGKIDFSSLARAALAQIDSLLRLWLPKGQREGHEWKALNPTRADQKSGSFSVNLTTGAWADFATNDRGGDLVSLYAYLFKAGDQGAAAKDLSEQLGIQAVDPHPPAHDTKKRSAWTPILPVPEDAPPHPVAHVKRGKPVASWTYRDAAGATLGVVYRFQTSDGGKDIIPCVYARHDTTGKCEWRWQAFPDPRPLYGLDGLIDDRTVLVVEGEKCRDAAQKLLPELVVITWPGGSKAVAKADWKPLTGRKVVIWPDCDAQCYKDGMMMPEAEQPGIVAAEKIAGILLDLGCRVRILEIPKPGEKPSGWDIYDAIHIDGWGFEEVTAFLLKKIRKPSSATSLAPADQTSSADEWRKSLVRRRGELVPCLANVYDIMAHSREWRGCVALDEFAQRTVKLKPPPFPGGEVGEWDSADDSRAAMWLSRHYDFTPSSPLVAEAVEVLARLNAYHPVRDWLRTLKWDGVLRCEDWMHDCLGVPKTEYTIRVAKWFLIGMVARVIQPGVKFDYCLVLEGRQGRGKSSALGILGGEWFGDTDIDLNNKDSMSALRGKWLYEFQELGTLSKAEASKQKSFLSRQVDEFRPVYGRREIRCPRQTVFAGSTNDWEWNKDPTGGRRFWPVEVGNEVDLARLRAMREQLFAEARVLFGRGERFFPSQEEQRRLFDPEQLKREQQESLIDALHDWVYDQYKEFSIAQAAFDGLKLDASKLTRDLQTRIGMALRKLGCGRVERRNGMIRYWYKPPERNEAGSKFEDSDSGNGGTNAPF